MSGGHWDYLQYRMRDIADDIEAIIEENTSEAVDDWGYPLARNYSPEAVAYLRVAALLTSITERALQRVDYLVSGDDGDDNFVSRWAIDKIPQDLDKLRRMWTKAKKSKGLVDEEPAQSEMFDKDRPL